MLVEYNFEKVIEHFNKAVKVKCEGNISKEQTLRLHVLINFIF